MCVYTLAGLSINANYGSFILRPPRNFPVTSFFFIKWMSASCMGLCEKSALAWEVLIEY